MTTQKRTPRRLALLGASLLAGAACGVWAYGFGAQLGGMLFGWVTGLNGAVIGALLASAALDRLFGGRG